MLSPEPSSELLEQYLTGTASLEAKRAVEQWAGRDTQRRAKLEALRHALAEANDMTASINVDVAWEHFTERQRREIARRSVRIEWQGARNRLGRETLRREPSTHFRAFSRSSLRALPAKSWIAALAVAGIVAVVVFGRGPSSAGHMQPPARTYTTVAGQRAIVTLPEGFRVQLGPMTTVAVSAQAAGDRIDVRVRGEALFQVTHRARTSFHVYTENAVARVLGTTFMVRQYPREDATRVVVTEGRVSLASVWSDSRHTAGPFTGILTSRTLGSVDDSGHVTVTPSIRVDDYTAWTTGQLIFRNTPIRDVIAEVERAYDVEFRVNDSVLATKHLTGTVPLSQQSLTSVLTILSDVLEAHPVRTGRVITFVPGRPAMRQSPDFSSPSPTERQYGK